MDLTKLKAVLGLSATAAATRQGIAWAPRLGQAADEFTFPAGADALYQVLLSGITDTAAPELDLLTGTVTANGATVSGGGTDFEGYANSAMGGLYALLFERLDSHASIMTITDDGFDPGTWWIGPGEKILHFTTGAVGQLGKELDATKALVFTAGAAANAQIRVTVLASIG